MLNVWTWMYLLGATSTVVVVSLALSRSANPIFRVPLALLAVDQFVLNGASIARTLTQDLTYSWVGAMVTPFFPVLLLHVALAFTGRLRVLRRVLVVTYAVFAAEAVLVVVDWLSPWVELGLSMHAIIGAVSSTPLLMLAAWLFWSHLREVVGESERQRTWLFIIALLVGAPLLLTDLFNDMGYPVPPLATAGSTVINSLLIVLTFGGTRASKRHQVGQALLFALFVIIVYLALFEALRDRQGILVLAISGFTLGLGAVTRLVWQVLARRREGLERFATLGRFSAQMAHDLKNPLAAARGAAELLEGELRALQKEDLTHFSALLVQQLDRLTKIIDRYQRLSRMELERQSMDVNELVTKVLSLQSFAGASSVTVTTSFAPNLPAISLDPELISSVVENLVKNAFEAMPKGGSITISTAREGEHLSLSVTDTGEGMGPRTREQAFELFYTTKASGSGLGLAFVKQIARAHGGDVRLESREGHGTRVELRLPLTPAVDQTRQERT